MFQAGVPEKTFQERIGHHSVQDLRIYERTTITQHMAKHPFHTKGGFKFLEFSVWRS